MAIWIVLQILTILMFDLGLTLKFEDFGKVFRRPWPIAIALLGQLVLLPLIALGLAMAFIAIASSPFIFANEEMAIPAILYSLMMNIVLLIYVGLVRRRNNM